MKSFFQEQFRYNQWANEKLLDFILENDLKNHRINPIFSHLTLAQVIWCDRLNKKSKQTKVDDWATWPWKEIDKKCRKTNKDLIKYVDSHSEDQHIEIIDFTTSSGVPYSRSVQQVLTQISYTTTFHRGQIAVVIHEENIMTPSTDYIDFVNS